MSGRIPDIEEELKKIQQQKQEYITYDDLSENEVIILFSAHLIDGCYSAQYFNMQ